MVSNNVDLTLNIANCMKCSQNEISNVMSMKAGMTNDSYLFTLHNRRYIYRVPGKGADGLVDRKNECEAYKAIRWLDISDKVVYYDKDSGIKISEYIENARTADGSNIQESIKCLLFAKNKLHKSNKHVSINIDIIAMINKYEQLMGKSKYSDYHSVKLRVLSSIRQFQKMRHSICLCHFDLNPDNFVIASNRMRLVDWEYAGMNDPMFDVAGWIVYKQYSHEQVSKLVAGYLEHEPSDFEMQKIRSCIAAMGLLWSNWCEYKRKCGQEFGDYAEQQYEYAREYSKIL